ncbi:MAG: non-canonical purine NTP pyrophosphatase [Candidatus Cryptobacteroides sp.]
MKKLVFATANRGKALEAAEILGDGYTLVLPSEIGIEEEADETGLSFRENSEIKARFIYDRIPLGGTEGFYAVFADDSGLETDALGGEPGIYTARYAGEDKNFRDNMDKLLSRLEDAGACRTEDRRARFRCSVTLIDASGRTIHCDGCLEGHIAFEKSGSGGFGYDPVFIPSDDELLRLREQGISAEDLEKCKGRTLAELPSSWKNLISHRYKALRELEEKLLPGI